MPHTVPGTSEAVAPVIPKRNTILSQTVEASTRMLPTPPIRFISLNFKIKIHKECSRHHYQLRWTVRPPAHCFVMHTSSSSTVLTIHDSPLPWERVLASVFDFFISSFPRRKGSNRKQKVTCDGHQPSGSKGLFLCTGGISSSILHLIF